MRSVTVSVADVDDEWLPDFGSFGKRPGHCAHQLRRMWIAILFLGKLHDQQPRARRSAPQPEIWIAPGSNRRHRRSMSGASMLGTSSSAPSRLSACSASSICSCENSRSSS